MTPDQEARFWSLVVVEPETSCWRWLGALGTGGYGRFHVGGTQRQAHRVMYEHANGPVPPSLVIDHLCRKRDCMNPAHMEPVTRGENVLRGEGYTARKARQTECDKGHPLTPDNTISQGRGHRRCRTCANAHAKARRVNRIARGFCGVCCKPRGADGTGTSCRSCADRDRSKSAAFRKEAAR